MFLAATSRRHRQLEARFFRVEKFTSNFKLAQITSTRIDIGNNANSGNLVFLHLVFDYVFNTVLYALLTEVDEETSRNEKWEDDFDGIRELPLFTEDEA